MIEKNIYYEKIKKYVMINLYEWVYGCFTLFNQNHTPSLFKKKSLFDQTKKFKIYLILYI